METLSTFLQRFNQSQQQEKPEEIQEVPVQNTVNLLNNFLKSKNKEFDVLTDSSSMLETEDGTNQRMNFADLNLSKKNKYKVINRNKQFKNSFDFKTHNSSKKFGEMEKPSQFKRNSIKDMIINKELENKEEVKQRTDSD